MRLIPGIVLCAALVGCGGGESTGAEDPQGSGSSGDEMSQSCEGYTRASSCITEENFDQCQEMATLCPGQVQVAESCPLQFSCPASASDSDSNDDPNTPVSSPAPQENPQG